MVGSENCGLTNIGASGDAPLDSLCTNERRADTLKDKRLYAKCLAAAKPSLRADESVEAIETATTLNPWWDFLFMSPSLILAIPALFNIVTVVFFCTYWTWFGLYLRKRGRMLVFTNQRFLVFESIGHYGFKSRISRELPKIPTPVSNARRIWRGLTWSRFNQLEEPLFIHHH